MEALQDVQAVHLDDLGIVGHGEKIEEILGGGEFLHRFGKGEFLVHGSFLRQGQG